MIWRILFPTLPGVAQPANEGRSDALTSLAVVAGIGAAFGSAWVDPVAGIVVAGAMLWLLGRTARRMSSRSG